VVIPASVLNHGGEWRERVLAAPFLRLPVRTERLIRWM
jgi:hypothetical protein